MDEIDLSLPSKFMESCVEKDNIQALKLVELMAKKNNCTIKAELGLLDFYASILSSEYRLPIRSMIKRISNYEA